MNDEARGSPLPPLLSGLEQVLALEHNDMTMVREEDEEEEYLPEEEIDEAAATRPDHHHGDVLPSTWDPSDSWGTDEDDGKGTVVPGVSSSSSSSSSSYKWRPEAAGPYHAALSSDRRTARYVGKANHPQDVGVVKADRPLPRSQACFYFEVEVLSTFEDRPTAAITVGLAAKGFPMHRQPGTWPHSYGYRGLDGRLFAALPPEDTAGGGGGGGGGGGATSNGSSSSSSSSGGNNGSTSTRGKDYGPAFGKGDVIGCGVEFVTQEVFYTKNGKFLGVAFRDIFRRPRQSQQHTGAGDGASRAGPVRTYGSGRRVSTSAAGAAPSMSSPRTAPTRASSILLSRSRFPSESTTVAAGGGGGGGVSGGGEGSSTASPRGLAAAALSLRAALRASWLADAGEEEEEDEEEEDAEQEDEEAGARTSNERRGRQTAGAGQEGGGEDGGRSRDRRSASFSARSSTASAVNRTDVAILYNTGGTFRQQQQHQQQQAATATSSPPAVAAGFLLSTPEGDWDLFPVLSLHGIGESARVNFGQEPFCFDLQAKRAADEAERERRLAVEGVGLGTEEEEEVHALIKDYLLVAGYQDTLRCFEAVTGKAGTTTSTASGATTTALGAVEGGVEQEEKAGEGSMDMDLVGSPADEEEEQPGTGSNSNGKNGGDTRIISEASMLVQSLYARTTRLSRSLSARQQLRQTLLSGGGVAAITKRLAKEYPRVWRRCPALRFDLYSLGFVDLLREGALQEALTYAQQELVPYALMETHTLEAEGKWDEAADRDGSMDVAVDGSDNDDGHPSDSNGHKKPLRRRRSHSTCEGETGGAAKRRLLAQEPASSSPSFSPSLDFAVRLREVMGLLAYYPNLTASPLAYLLSQHHREDVAEKLNLAILQEEGEGEGGEEKDGKEDRGRPLLERALVGLASMHDTLREIKSGGRGEGFRLPVLSRAQQA